MNRILTALPTLRALTGELREVHGARIHPHSGGVGLHWHKYRWCLWIGPSFGRPVAGCEFVPGDGAPFDAVAAARRLLAAVRDYDSGGRDDRL